MQSKLVLYFSLLSAFFIVSPVYAQIPTPTPIYYNAAGSAIRFYGTGSNGVDRIKIPLDNPVTKANIGTGDFTIEWWMKAGMNDNNSGACSSGANNWTSGNIIFDRDIYGPAEYGDFGISLAGGVIAFGVNNGTSGYTLCGLTPIADNGWHHVAVTRRVTDGLMSIFIDGGIDTQYKGPAGDISYKSGRATSYVNDPFLVIGAEKHDAGSAYPSYNGFIDEIRISDIRRYTDAFTLQATPFNPDSNTVLLYHFNDCDKTVPVDSSTAFGGPLNGQMVVGGNPPGPVYVPSDVPFFQTSPFSMCGVTPTPIDICARKTKGDANCDGLTNLIDFEQWRKEFLGELVTVSANFNADAKVTLLDFELWRKGFLNEF